MDTHFFLLTDFFFIHRDVLEMNGLDKIARRSKRVGGAIADLWGPKAQKITPISYGKKIKLLLLFRFFLGPSFIFPWNLSIASSEV